MFNSSRIYTALGLALLTLSPAVQAEFEWNAYVRNRTALNLRGDQYTGEAQSTLDTSSDHAAGNVMMFENAARFFLNGDLGAQATWHADINLIYDTQGVSSYWRQHLNYSQYDYLRELYVDTSLAGVDLRLGKQQVVWGTADGIKLLDIINPTDFRRLNQDDMEESRIPVWMAVAEYNLGETGNLQGVISQHRPNVIPGLRKGERGVREVGFGIAPNGFPTGDNSLLFGTDADHPFILKGVDTITGQVNGFANIGAAMGAVTATFYGDGMNNTFTNPLGGIPMGPGDAGNPAAPEIATVGLFTSLPNSQTPAACQGLNGAACLKNFTELTNDNITNLTDANPLTGAGWDVVKPNSGWEYFPNATFATFNAFRTMNTRYTLDYPDETDPNLGLRYKGNLPNGFNFSLNYLYAYDSNPAVDLHWADPNTGERLQVVDATYANPLNPSQTLHTLQLKNAAGQFYGAPAVDFSPLGNAAGLSDVNPATNWAGTGPQLVFEESLNRIHNIGGSFDHSLDVGLFDVPVVLRGELLYQKDVRSPIIDRYNLSYGNLTEGLKTQEGDYFKYVLGLDVTVFTNLLISGQFIQFRNLDYVDETVAQVNGLRFNRYTGDQANLSLTNQLRRGYENKEFYSLFLSKPFGPSQEHRFNNITIFEEGGGWWNRLNVEYTFRDELLGLVEWNQYWGGDNTTFGQFDNSSSVMVGLKYLIE